jgi:hypothetical protein
MCDHVKKKMVDNVTKECIDCGQRFCTHPRMDYDSTCMECGEYVTEISIEQTWHDYNTRGSTCGVIKNTKDHIKYLESIGYSTEIIEQTMDKFTKVGCSLSEESAIVAVCVWLTFWDNGLPHTLIEIAKKHKLSKSKIKEARQTVLTFNHFKDYRTKYITPSSMIKKILIAIGLRDFDIHFPNIFNMTVFIEEHWDLLKTTKRSAPQNIASACIYFYLQNSSLSDIIDTSMKKKELCKIMGPSYITIDKLAKQIGADFVKIK